MGWVRGGGVGGLLISAPSCAGQSTHSDPSGGSLSSHSTYSRLGRLLPDMASARVLRLMVRLDLCSTEIRKAEAAMLLVLACDGGLEEEK